MQATGNKISPDINIADESLIHNPHNDYELSVMPSADGLVFCVHDNHKNKFTALHNYSFYPSLDDEELADRCEQIIREDNLLSSLSFRAITVGLPGRVSTLIPSALFDKESADLFLEFNHQPAEHMTSHHEKVGMADAYNVYRYNPALLRCWEKVKGKLRFMHYATPLLQGMLVQHRWEEEAVVIVHVRRDSFDIMVCEGKDLQVFNIFDYKAPEDVLFHVLNVMEQMDLDPEHDKLIMAGQVEKRSAVYEILHKYVKTITFSSRVPNADFSYGFSALAAHKFYPLFALRQCVS